MSKKHRSRSSQGEESAAHPTCWPSAHASIARAEAAPVAPSSSRAHAIACGKVVLRDAIVTAAVVQVRARYMHLSPAAI
jgi:hypothetical protein